MLNLNNNNSNDNYSEQLLMDGYSEDFVKKASPIITKNPMLVFTLLTWMIWWLWWAFADNQIDWEILLAWWQFPNEQVTSNSDNKWSWARESVSREVQLNNSREIIELLWNFITIQDITFQSNQVDFIYDKYKELNLSPNVKLYLKSILLDIYIGILKSWYSIEWYEDLDRFVNIIGELSEWKISVSIWETMPQDSEFSNTITIYWELKSWNLLIEKKWFSIFSIWEKNKSNIEINFKTLIIALLLDTPNTIEEAKLKIWELNGLYLDLKEELRKSNSKIWELEYEIKKLEKDKEELRKSFELKFEQITNDKINIIQRKIDEHKLEIESLTKIHEKQVSKLETRIWSLQQQIEELIKKHEEEILSINATNTAEIKKLQDEFEERLLRLQESFNEERNNFNIEIESLKKEKQNLLILHEAETSTLKDQIDELAQSNTSLLSKITELNNDIINLKQSIEVLMSAKESLNKELTRKDEEYKKLQSQYDELTSQINTIENARLALIDQLQSNLSRLESLNTRLKQRINWLETQLWEAKSRISFFEEEKVRLLKYEDDAQELVWALEQIDNMKKEIEALEKEKQSLIEENERLNLDSLKLKEIQEKLQQYDEILSKLNEALVNVDRLEKENSKLQSDLEQEWVKNEWLQRTIENQRQNINSLLQQLDEYKKAYDDLVKWNITISRDNMTEAMRQLRDENQALNEKIEWLEAQLVEKEQENKSLNQRLQQTVGDYEELIKKMKKDFTDKIAQLMKKILIDWGK